MSDILRAEDIETCKENIQPLREGRRASALKTMVSNTKTAEEIEAERSYVHTMTRNSPEIKTGRPTRSPAFLLVFRSNMSVVLEILRSE